jgi:hypothetical protein
VTVQFSNQVVENENQELLLENRTRSGHINSLGTGPSRFSQVTGPFLQGAQSIGLTRDKNERGCISGHIAADNNRYIKKIEL